MKGRPIRLCASLLALLLLAASLAGCAKRENQTAYASLSDMRGKTIAVLSGSMFDTLVQQAVQDAKVSYFNGLPDQIAALRAGRVDAVCLDEPVAALNANLYPELTTLPQPVSLAQYGLALRKGDALRAKFDTVLERFRADGTLDALKAEWLGADESAKSVLTQDWPGANGTIRYQLDVSAIPVSYLGEGGGVMGYEPDLVMMVARELDMAVETTICNFDALIPALQSGKCDLVSGCMIITEERQKQVDFTVPYYDGSVVLLILASQRAAATYATLQDFDGARFGSSNGSIFDQLVDEALGAKQAHSYYQSTADQIAALKADRVDAVVLDEPVAGLAVSKNTGLKVFPQPIDTDYYGIACRKGSGLAEKLSAVITRFRADGTLAALKTKWLGADESLKTLPEQTWAGANGTLRYYHDTTTEPMCYVGPGGESLGLDLDLVLQIGRELDYKIDCTVCNFDGLIPALESGKADLVSGSMSITEERAKKVDFTAPYYDGAAVLVIRDEGAQEARVGFWEGLAASFNSTFVVEDRWKLIAEGLGVTVLISVLSGVAGLALGFALCMLRRSRAKPSRWTSAVLVRLIQGMPVVVLLMILYYIVFGSLDISGIAVAVVGFSINFGAYTSEMMRSGIDAVDGGQREAALAMGYGRASTFWRIVFPQAARHFLPVLKGEFISMVKMTSVVGYIAVQDLTKVSDIIRSRTMEAFFPLIATAAVYFAIANLMTAALSLVERRIDPTRKKRTVKGVRMQ